MVWCYLSGGPTPPPPARAPLLVPLVGATGAPHAPRGGRGGGGDGDGNDVLDTSDVLLSGGAGGTVNIWQVGVFVSFHSSPHCFLSSLVFVAAPAGFLKAMAFQGIALAIHTIGFAQQKTARPSHVVAGTCLIISAN